MKDIFKKGIKTNIIEYKESKYKKAENNNKARIDDKFNTAYGTLTHNLKEFLNYCNDYCILVLTGHTHALNEYRIQKLNNVGVNDKKKVITI